MRKLQTIIRGSLHTIANTLVLLVIVFYLAVHFNLTGYLVRHSLTHQLAEQLGTRVTVEGDVEVDWLNQVVLNHLAIYDQHDDTLLYARRVLVAYDILPLLSHHLVLNTCQLIDFDIRTSRPSADSIANYQFLVDALTTKNPNSQPLFQEIDLNAIHLRQGSLSYHVLDKPQLEQSPIDPNHISVSKLSANVHLHENRLTIKRFRCMEHETSFKLDRFELALDALRLLKQPDGENSFVFSVKELLVESNQLKCHAQLNGTSDEVRLQLDALDLPSGHSLLKGIDQLSAQASISINNFKQSTDSLHLAAHIHHLDVLVDTIGQINASGDIEGMPCHSQIRMMLNSDLGNAEFTGNIEFVEDEAGSKSLAQRTLIAQGHCNTSGIDLGRLIPEKYELGTVAMNMDYKVQHRPQQPLSVSLKGMANQLQWRKHTYRNVKIDGSNQGNRLAGNVALEDSLGSIQALFDLELSQQQPRYRIDGRISRLNPNALGLSEVTYLDSLAISAAVHADIIAPRGNGIEGELKLTDLVLDKGDQLLELEPVLFEGNKTCGELSSPVVRLKYNLDRNNNNYVVKGLMPVATELFDMLNLPVSVKKVSPFELRIDSARQINLAHIDLPEIDLRNGLSAAALLEMQSNADGNLLPDLGFEAWNHDHRLIGNLRGIVRLDPLDIDLDSTTFQFDNEELELSGAHLRRSNDGVMYLDDLQLKGKTQSISASGKLGANQEKDLSLRLDNFDIGQILGSLPKGYLHFGGRATGEILMSGEQSNLLTAEHLKIQDFSYIDTILGNADLQLDYALDDKVINAICDIVTDSIHHTHIDAGIFLDERDSLELDVYPDRLPIGFINYWTGDILQHLGGRVSGPVRLYGAMNRLQLAGTPTIDCQFTHQMIGANFHLRDTVFLEPNLIALKNARVDDCHGHPLTLNARVPHQYLKHFGYDVNIDMPDANQGFLVMDRKQQPGRIYWGQIYAKGTAHLAGGNGKHRFDINVGTTDKSWFYLSPREQDLNPDQDAYTFLTFRDKAQLLDQADDEILDQEAHTKTEDKEPESKTDLKVSLNVNVNEQCQVTVQMDPLSEDKLIGRGNGNLSVQYDPNDNLTLGGIYHVSEGTYSMNVKGDLVNKVFQLQNTSQVKFDGVPSDAELLLNCRYNIPSVNLTDLDESIVTLSSLSRSSAPVDCNLCISGKMDSPQIRFDLEVKNVSDEIQAYVHNIIGTQEMLNQEVLYLLIFSKFYTPQYAQSTQSRTGSELTSFASASLTSQLNQLLGHLSNNFTMGTNFRSDKGDFSDMEMDLSLSTRLLGDRLLLNGNVGYRDPANRVGMARNGSSFIGDFDLEFLIKDNGSVRAKAYSHYNERDYSINNALTTQGIGFILRKDFEVFSDLLPWNIRRNRILLRQNKEEKTSIPEK